MSTKRKEPTKRKTPDRTGVRVTRPYLKLERVAKVLAECRGVQAHAAKALGITKGSMCEWVGRHPELRKIIDEHTPGLLYEARDNIVTLMDSADEGVRLRAASKVIDVYGGQHGIGARYHRHSGPDGGAIPFTHDLSSLSDDELEALRSIRAKLAATDGGDRGGDRPPEG